MRACQFVFVILFVLLFGVGFRFNYESMLAGKLLITEVYYDTLGDDSREEWVEITNVGTAVIDLSDVKIGDEEEAGGGEGMKRFPRAAQIMPGQAIIVAQSAVGFRTLFGFSPEFEILDSDTAVPDMRNYSLWTTGDVALANDGDEVVLMDGSVIIDAISYGDSTSFFAPAIASVYQGQSIERMPANCDSDTAADWQPNRSPSPGSVTVDNVCAEVDAAAMEALIAIGEIQGVEDVSPMVNQQVTFRGVVTGWYEDRNAKGVTYYTLFVQDLPGFGDGDPVTSDGIAVFLGRKRPSYNLGDQLRITGQVTEFFGFTEIGDENLQILVEAENVPLPEPVALPLDGADFERYESMQVAIPQEMVVVGPTHRGCGLTVGVENGRVFQRDEITPTQFMLPVLHTTDVGCAGFPQLKTGDRIEGLSGTLVYQFDQFRLVQHDAESLDIMESKWPELPQAPVKNEDQITIATMNLENFFDAVDDTGERSEPKYLPEAIELKRIKIAYAIEHLLGCPTLLGVQEVEHAHLLLDLADALELRCGFRYEVSHLESPDSRGIDVALLSDSRLVVVESESLQQTCTLIETGIYDPNIVCEGLRHPLFSRPPLQVKIAIKIQEDSKQTFTLFINHFKSKREGVVETAPRRLAQAEYINQLVREILTEDPSANIIVMGDFNDFEHSPTLQHMTDKGHLVNPHLRIPDIDRYSYVYGGVSQLIDGILLSPELVDRVVVAGIQHTSADYPFGLGEDVSEQRIGYRVTDHDLLFLMLDFGEEVEIIETATPVLTPPDPTPIDQSVVLSEDYDNRRGKIVIGSSIGFLAFILLIGIQIKFKS